MGPGPGLFRRWFSAWLPLAGCAVWPGAGRPPLDEIEFRSLHVVLAGSEGNVPVRVDVGWTAPGSCAWGLTDLQVDLDGVPLDYDMVTRHGEGGDDGCPDEARWRMTQGSFPRGPGDRTVTLTLDGQTRSAVLPSPRDLRHLVPVTPLTALVPGAVLRFGPSRPELELLIYYPRSFAPLARKPGVVEQAIA